MSAQELHAGHGGHHAGSGDIHVTLSDYVKGFVLAVLLTAIPFALVMGDVIQSRTTAVLVLGLFAAVQIVVHMVYFLHMNGKLQGGWTLLSTLFTVIFLAVTIVGTLWVMLHMNANMMPAHTNPMAAQSAAPAAPAMGAQPPAR